MKKTILTLSLAAVMILSLVGCSGGTSSSSDLNTTTNTSSDTKSDIQNSSNSGDVIDAGGDTLTLWLPPFGSEDTTDKEFWTAQLAEAAELINVNLVIETIPWDNYEEKYLTGVSSGAGPDIGYMYNEMLSNYVDMGALEPLEQYFTQEEIDNYLYWDKGHINGVQYTLPFIVGAPRVLYCNMDLLNAAGYDSPPTTWAELEEVALAITDATGKVGFQQYWGGYFGDLNETFFPYLWQAGGDIYDSDGNLTINSEEGVKAAEWLLSLKEKGILTESATSLDGSAVGDEFKAGNIGMYVSSTTSAKKITEAGINWDYIPYLSETGDTQGATCAVADSLVILSSCKNKEAAAYILKEMTKASTMEEFHQQLYAMPPISADEKYYDNEKFESMYTDYADGFHTLPVQNNASQVYSTLFSNLQLMMMGDLTPEEALNNTVTYAESMS